MDDSIKSPTRCNVSIFLQFPGFFIQQSVIVAQVLIDIEFLLKSKAFGHIRELLLGFKNADGVLPIHHPNDDTCFAVFFF